MTRSAVPLFAVLCAGAALAAPAAAAEVQIAATGPVVELSVSQTIDARPDIATVSAGVTTRAPTAVAAMQQNAATMTAVRLAIRPLRPGAITARRGA